MSTNGTEYLRENLDVHSMVGLLAGVFFSDQLRVEIFFSWKRR